MAAADAPDIGSDGDSPVPGPSTPPQYTRAGEPARTHPFIDGRGETLAYRSFRDEATDLHWIVTLCSEELSEPYNVYTFRYFLTEWPHLTLFVYPSADDPTPIATIICKQDMHRERTNRGYIGMLSVARSWRRRGIGERHSEDYLAYSAARKLVELAVSEMEARGAHEVVLETEHDNAVSLALYEDLGFVREKRLHRFYSNGKDAYRLILPLGSHPLLESADEADRARWLAGQMDYDAVGGSVDFLFAGPPPYDEDDPENGGPIEPGVAKWVDDEVARLRLSSGSPLAPRPRPEYIM